MLNNTKSTSDFYSELRTLLQTGDVQQWVGQKVGGASTGVGKGGAGEGTRRQSATEATVLMRKQQVDIAQTRALKSLRELAKRNEEAERRAKATVHAMSAKYLKMLGQNPDIRDGDPLYFFGYGLECMEDIIFAGFCQVNASVNLYLEEIDTRFNNLLVMSEEIEKALEKARQLREETKEEEKQIEFRQSEWLKEVKGGIELQWLKFLETRENAENERVKEVKKSNRSLKMMMVAFAFLVVLIEVVPRVLGIR
jgi:hypothetical protein